MKTYMYIAKDNAEKAALTFSSGIEIDIPFSKNIDVLKSIASLIENGEKQPADGYICLLIENDFGIAIVLFIEDSDCEYNFSDSTLVKYNGVAVEDALKRVG